MRRAVLLRKLLLISGFYSFTLSVDVISVSTGSEHTCALLNDLTVKCWGAGLSGQLGYGDDQDLGDEPNEMGGLLPTVQLGSGRTVVQVSAGSSSTCALLDDGTVKCWGSGNHGRLGYGDTQNRGDDPNEMGDDLPVVDLGSGRTAVQIGDGGSYTCVVLDDATIKCWGVNHRGQLGYGDTNSRGDSQNEMGDDLLNVELGSGRIAVAIATENSHTCVLLNDGAIKCWGKNDSGQLGYGDRQTRGDEPGEMGDALPSVQLGTGRTAVQVSVGDDHSCALLDDGTIKCWGRGDTGQLGYGSRANKGDDPNEMGNSLPIVDIGAGRSAVQLATGAGHNCAILDDGTVKCWGLGDEGRLGYNDTDNRGDDPNEMGDFLPTVALGAGRTAVQISSKRHHTCALLDDATIKCWGVGSFGRLGYGDTENRGDAANEMGNFLPTVDLFSTLAPTSVPTSVPTAAPSTLKPTTSPITSSPTSSPITSSPTSSPTSSSPTTSPSLKGATTFVGQTLIFDNENGGGNAWTDAELRALEIQDIETLTQACLVSETSLRLQIGLTLGRVLAFKALFNCDGVPTPSPVARPQDNQVGLEIGVGIGTGLFVAVIVATFGSVRQKLCGKSEGSVTP